MTHDTSKPMTLFDKVWKDHVVTTYDDGTALVYVDRQPLHEVTSPQAFGDLRRKGINTPFNGPAAHMAVVDHNIPTKNIDQPISDRWSALQVETLRNNAAEFGIQHFGLGERGQGIVHMVSLETGFVLPGCTVICGDSHTSTYGAVGAMAFGIGTSKASIQLQTGCIEMRKPKTMRISVSGNLRPGVTPKDVILYIIQQIGFSGGTGYAIEYAGSVFRDMDIDGRCTVCNMTIEAGAQVGMVAVDEKTVNYCANTASFKAMSSSLQQRAVKDWQSLRSDEGAVFDREVEFNAADIRPTVTWGTNPAQSVSIGETLPIPDQIEDPAAKTKAEEAYAYTGLMPGAPTSTIPVDHVFVGSCTNGRLSDLRQVADVVRGKMVSSRLKSAVIVSGSWSVKQQAESEGLHQIFLDAGFQWRDPGCSSCLAMNEDKIPAGDHCVSTSNRNFKGRQGQGSKTQLCSPLVAALVAVHGSWDISTELAAICAA